MPPQNIFNGAIRIEMEEFSNRIQQSNLKRDREIRVEFSTNTQLIILKLKDFVFLVLVTVHRIY